MSKGKSIWVSLPFVILFILFISSSFGTYFYLKSRLSSDKISKTIANTVRQFLPGAKVVIEDVHLKVGSGFKIGVDNIVLKDQTSNQTLLAVPYITLKVPLISLLSGRGNVEFLFDQPQIFYHSQNGLSHWHKVFRKDLIENKKLVLKEKVSLPYVFKRAKLSLRANDVLIEYNLNGNKSGLIPIKKVIAKNLGLTTNIGLEVVKAFEGHIGANATLITSVNLGEFLHEDKLTSRSLVRLTNITLPFRNTNVRSLNMDMTTEINSQGEVLATVSSKYEQSHLSFNMLYQSKKEKVEISNISSSVYLKDFFPNDMNISSSRFEIEGRSNDKPSLSIDLLNYYWDFAGDKHLINVNGLIKNDELRLTSQGKLFSGNYSADFSALVDFKKGFSNLYSMFDNIKGGVELSNAELPLDIFERKNYLTLGTQTTLPKSTIDFSIKKSKLSTDHKIDGTLTFISDLNKIKVNDLIFSVDQAKINSSHRILLTNNSIDHNVDLDVEALPASLIKPIFTDHFSLDKGEVSASLEGFYRSNYKGRYYDAKLSYDFNIKNGLLTSPYLDVGMNSLEETLKSMSILKKPLKDYLDGSFQYISLQGNVENDAYFIEGLKINLRDKLKLVGNGVIYNKRNLKAKSELFLTLSDQIGITQIPGKIPFLLEGRAGKLRPNYQYTMSKLLKKIIK